MYEHAVANMANAQWYSAREVMLAMQGIAHYAKHAPVKPEALRDSMIQTRRWATGEWRGA